MRILIIGDRGQLGFDCQYVLRRAHEVIGIDLPELDITKRESVDESIRTVSPDIVLNCAAYTNVDACENDREQAWAVNVEGPRNLAQCIKKCGGKLVHISTDYVFSGRRIPPKPYNEDDVPSPLSFYGSTKYEGELAVRKTTDSHVIIRTAWLYGINGRNFLKTMLKLALKDPRKVIRVVNDQFGSPTWSYRLALQIEKMIHADAQGTYHVTSEGFCSWHELARTFLSKMDIPFTLLPCATDEYPTPAIRPKNSILENARVKEEGINIMRFWQVDLEEFVRNCRDILLKEVCPAEIDGK